MGVHNSMTNLFSNIQPWVPALATLITFLILRKLFVGLGFWLLKKLTARTPFKFDTTMVHAAEGPVSFMTLTLAVTSAVSLVPNIDLERWQPVLLSFFSSCAMVAIFWFIYNLTQEGLGIIGQVLRHFKVEEDNVLERFIRVMLRALIIAFALVFVARAWGYDVPGLLAGLGVGGIAIALAAQETLASIVGGVMLIVDKPFVVGDRIKTAAGEGVVQNMGFRTTKVQTFAQGIINIPNSALSKDSVTNWSKIHKRRVEMRIGLTYDTTPEKMEECVRLLREFLANQPDIPAEDTVVIFDAYTANSLEVWITYTTTILDYNVFCRFKEMVNINVMKIVHSLGLHFAFPSTSVYFENTLPMAREGIKRP